jgi:hypothetical protein
VLTIGNRSETCTEGNEISVQNTLHIDSRKKHHPQNIEVGGIKTTCIDFRLNNNLVVGGGEENHPNIVKFTDLTPNNVFVAIQNDNVIITEKCNAQGAIRTIKTNSTTINFARQRGREALTPEFA